MPRQRGLNRNSCCLQVTNFADHHDIRILTQDRAQRLGKVQSNLRLNLNLVDSGKLVFDRIFDGKQLQFRTIEMLQRRVKRCRFSASGRAGHKDDTVRQRHQAMQVGLRCLIKAKLREIELDARAVENSHHNTFAEDRRQRRNTNIDLDATHGRLDAAIMRQSSLGDIELGHDLDSRGQRSPERRRNEPLLLQESVDPIADRDRVASWLDVDVGSAPFDRPGDDLIDKPDDWRLVGNIPKPLDIEFTAIATDERRDFLLIVARFSTRIVV